MFKVVLTFLVFTAKLPSIRTASGFTPKTECILDFTHDEYEADENEGGGQRHSDRAWPEHVGRSWPGVPPTGPNSGMAPPTGFYGAPPTGFYGAPPTGFYGAPPTGFHAGMDAEDLRERMGLDEMEEGRSQAYGGGRGLHGGHFGAGGEADEREWGGDKRRRRRRQAYIDSYYQRGRHSPTVLSGTLTCGQTAMIHISNVTVGYSPTAYCFQAYEGCQAGSSKAKQVIHCQGRKGSCDFTIRRHFIARCGHMVNFASVAYECISASDRINICSSTNSDVSGAVAIATPSYPLATGQKLSPDAELLTCECILRASSGSTFEVEYLRTHMSQKDSVCDGDMVLLERPDQASRSLDSARYSLERELCGTNVSTHMTILDSILRVTFLGGAPLSGDTAGFLGKFTAWSSSGDSELFHISCSGTDPALTLEAATQSSRQSEWRRNRDQRLPPNFDPSLLANGNDALSRDRLVGAAKSQGHVDKMSEIDTARGVSIGSEAGGSHIVEENEESKSDPGILSGVVASLAAVILILLSVGTLIFYRRRKKRLRKRVEEADYTDYQSDAYYDGVRASKEERVPRRSHSLPHRPHTPKNRWSDSKLAEYGWMLVRVLSRQNSPRPADDSGDTEINAGTSSCSRPGGNDRIRKGVSGGNETESDVYDVAPPKAAERRVKCFAEIHRDLRPPTRRAPRPPLRPPPVLNKASQSVTPVSVTEACHSPVAPPRKQRFSLTCKSDPGTSSSPYDNAVDVDTTLAPSQRADVTNHDVIISASNPTCTVDTATIMIEQEAEAFGDASLNALALDNDLPGKKVSYKDNADEKCMKTKGAGRVTHFLLRREDQDEEAEIEDTIKTGSDEDEVIEDNISEAEETYTSINELNEALYNLEQQIQELQ